MKWRVFAVVAFVLGYGTRGVIDTAGWPWWVALLLYVPLGAMTWRWARQAAKKAKSTPAPLFGPGALLGSVYETPHAPHDQVIFTHPDLLQKLIRDAGPMLFEAPRINDNRHLPGCMKRRNPEAVCICGERGFGLRSEALNPKPFQEFGLNFERERKCLLECGHEWWSDDAPVGYCGRDISKPGHRCTRHPSHFAKNDACMCGNCQATTIAPWKKEFLTPTCPEWWHSAKICPLDDNRAVHKCAKAETHGEKPEDVNHACGCGETRSA